MSEGVTYADLRFVKTPPKKGQEKDTWNQLDQIRMPPSGPHPSASLATDPSEGELTYENIQAPSCQEERPPPTRQGTKKSDRRTWYTLLALLAACLFLLATAIGMGVRYWQVSRQLQQAKEDGSVLAQRVGTKEGSLAQTQAQLEEAKGQLHSTNGSLWGCWDTGNRTQEELRDQGKRLREASQSLTLSQQEKKRLQRDKEELEKEKEEQQRDKARLLQEKESLQQQLGEMRRKVEQDCCPNGWKLFRLKCLWISEERKTWWRSQETCIAKSAQLLILNPWSTEEVWASKGIDKNDQYWIGLNNWGTWKWVDGTDFEGTESIGNCQNSPGRCIQMSQGALQDCYCGSKKRFICVKETCCQQPWGAQ